MPCILRHSRVGNKDLGRTPRLTGWRLLARTTCPIRPGPVWPSTVTHSRSTRESAPLQKRGHALKEVDPGIQLDENCWVPGGWEREQRPKPKDQEVTQVPQFTRHKAPPNKGPLRFERRQTTPTAHTESLGLWVYTHVSRSIIEHLTRPHSSHHRFALLVSRVSQNYSVKGAFSGVKGATSKFGH